MPEFDDTRVVWGVPGPPGSVSGSATLTDHETRIAAIEGTTIPAAINDLTDVSGTPATGDVLRYDGSGWVPDTDEKTVAFIIPFILGDGSASIADGWPFVYGVCVNFAATITGYVLEGNGEIAITVEKAPSTAPTAYVTISGTETPNLGAGGGTNDDQSLTTWTTAVGAFDRLRINVAAGATASHATLTLLLTRTI